MRIALSVALVAFGFFVCGSALADPALRPKPDSKVDAARAALQAAQEKPVLPAASAEVAIVEAPADVTGSAAKAPSVRVVLPSPFAAKP